MKILVTGATGFIGSHIAERLKREGHDIYILIRKKEKNIRQKYKTIIYNENINDLISDFKRVNLDLVIHCAAFFVSEHKTEDVDNLIKSNILLTNHLLEAMYITGVKKIINTSTSWQHYNDEEYNPVCLYAATKQAAEDIIKFYVEAKQIQAINLTIYDSYGKNDSRNKIINLFNKLDNNKEYLNMSLGEQYIDLIYIKDIVDAYITAMNIIALPEYKGMQKYYLHSNNPMKLKDVAKTYEKVNNTVLNINWGKLKYRDREVMNIYIKGKILPNWKPKYTLEQGLIDMKNGEE